MGNPFEGSRRLDISEKTPMTPDWGQRIQDDMIEAWEARRLDATGLFISDDLGSWVGYYTTVSGQYYIWQSGSSPNGDRMWAPALLRVSEKIVNIDVIYKGSNRTGGEIALYERQHISVGSASVLLAPSKLFDLGENATNPWQPSSNPTYYHRVRTTVNKILEEGYQYYVSVQASTTGAGNAEEFCALIINPQSGTGA